MLGCWRGSDAILTLLRRITWEKPQSVRASSQVVSLQSLINPVDRLISMTNVSHSLLDWDTFAGHSRDDGDSRGVKGQVRAKAFAATFASASKQDRPAPALRTSGERTCAQHRHPSDYE